MMGYLPYIKSTGDRRISEPSTVRFLMSDVLGITVCQRSEVQGFLDLRSDLKANIRLKNFEHSDWMFLLVETHVSHEKRVSGWLGIYRG